METDLVIVNRNAVPVAVTIIDKGAVIHVPHQNRQQQQQQQQQQTGQ